MLLPIFDVEYSTADLCMLKLVAYYIVCNMLCDRLAALHSDKIRSNLVGRARGTPDTFLFRSASVVLLDRISSKHTHIVGVFDCYVIAFANLLVSVFNVLLPSQPKTLLTDFACE